MNVDVVDVDDDSDYVDDDVDVDVDVDVDDDSDYIGGDGLHNYLGSKGFGFQVWNKH